MTSTATKIGTVLAAATFALAAGEATACDEPSCNHGKPQPSKPTSQHQDQTTIVKPVQIQDTTVINKPTTIVKPEQTTNVATGPVTVTGAPSSSSSSSSSSSNSQSNAYNGGNNMTIKQAGDLNMGNLSPGDMHALYTNLCTTNDQEVGFAVTFAGTIGPDGKMYGAGFTTGSESHTKVDMDCMGLQATIQEGINITNVTVKKKEVVGKVAEVVAGRSDVGCSGAFTALAIVNDQRLDAYSSVCRDTKATTTPKTKRSSKKSTVIQKTVAVPVTGQCVGPNCETLLMQQSEKVGRLEAKLEAATRPAITPAAPAAAPAGAGN